MVLRTMLFLCTDYSFLSTRTMMFLCTDYAVCERTMADTSEGSQAALEAPSPHVVFSVMFGHFRT